MTTFERPIEIFRRSIESILQQTYKDIEIIVINDSKESIYTVDIRNYINMISKQYEYIVYIENDKHMGANYSRNKGIDLSHGELVAFLDDDDEWLEEKLMIQLERFSESKVGLVYSDYYRYLSSGVCEKCYKAHRHGYVSDELMCHNIIGVTSGVIVRRECFDICGKFDERLQARQDYDMWVRICEHFEVEHVSLFLFNYYVSENGISSNIKNRINGRKMVLKKYKSYYEHNPQAHCATLAEFFYEMASNNKVGVSLCILVKLIIMDVNFVRKKKLVQSFIDMIIKHKVNSEEFY